MRTLFISIYAYPHDTGSKPLAPVEAPARSEGRPPGARAHAHVGSSLQTVTWGKTAWDGGGALGALVRGGTAQSDYYNPDFDGLIDEAQTSIDPRRRLELYARAQRMVVDDGGVLPLYQQVDIYGVNKRLSFQALSSEQLVGAWMSLRNGK